MVGRATEKRQKASKPGKRAHGLRRSPTDERGEKEQGVILSEAKDLLLGLPASRSFVAALLRMTIVVRQ
jgi:hypothetical protein